jgi:hypothetical protein
MFCNKCGNQLQAGDNFCSKCGANISAITSATSPNDDEQQSGLNATAPDPQGSDLVFTSKLILGGNVIRPDRLIINEKNIVYEKRNRYLIGVDRVMIPYSRIASVEFDRGLISSRIVIYSKGNQAITVDHFSVSDGKKIKEEIERRL